MTSVRQGQPLSGLHDDPQHRQHRRLRDGHGDLGRTAGNPAGGDPRRGFTQVLLDAGDIAQHPGGLEAAVHAVEASGLRITGLQWLRDFEGLSGRQHTYKLEIAKAMLQMAHALGAQMLLVSSSTHLAAAQEPATIARDLRKLSMLAVRWD